MLSRRLSGFTLIELAIVLIIIGLVMGGITVGRVMIEAAKVRAQITQIEKYSVAVNTFKEKYGELPGDMPVAKASNFFFQGAGFWGYLPNGDGRFNNASFYPAQYLSSVGFEHQWFFLELSLAGLIQGKYCAPNINESGQQQPGYCPDSYPANLNQKFPAGFANNAYGFLPISINKFGGNWWIFNVRTFSDDNGCISRSYKPLTPSMAYQLDTKMDDGLPATGLVRAFKQVCCASPDSDDCVFADDNMSQGYYSPANCVKNGGGSYDVTQSNYNCISVVRMQ